MHGKPGHDYLADFATIGAEPGCSPAELEAAWRRRVSELHPDRAPRGAGQAGAPGREVLLEINGAYRRLRDFQRRHGRMPGSAPTQGSPGHDEPRLDWDHGPSQGERNRTWLLALFNASLLALVAVLVWVLLERLGIRDRDGPGGRACVVACASPPSLPVAGHRLHLAPLRNSTTSTV